MNYYNHQFLLKKYAANVHQKLVSDQDLIRGRRAPDLGTLRPGTWDLSQSSKVGPKTALKFNIRTLGPPTKFKSRTPELPSKVLKGTLGLNHSLMIFFF